MHEVRLHSKRNVGEEGFTSATGRTDWLRLSSAVLFGRQQAGFCLRWREIEGLILMAAKTPLVEELLAGHISPLKYF